MIRLPVVSLLYRVFVPGITSSTGNNSLSALGTVIQPGLSSLVDVSRTIYSEASQDLRALLLTYQSLYNLPSLRLHSSVKRGVFLSVRNEDASKLPAAFVQRVRLGTQRLTCTTDEVANLGERCKKSLNEIIFHSYKFLLSPLISSVYLLLESFVHLKERSDKTLEYYIEWQSLWPCWI